VAGCTGASSEKAVQALFDLPDIAMLDMGDFYGGMVKYLRRNPVERVTIGGGLGKLTKLAQGAVDLHSGRSQVDFAGLAQALGVPQVAGANTVLEVSQSHGAALLAWLLPEALKRAEEALPGVTVDIVAVSRAGEVVGQVSSEGRA
jgi:cobalt-precorrin-5B (C1)-methyltransferase